MTYISFEAANKNHWTLWYMSQSYHSTSAWCNLQLDFISNKTRRVFFEIFTASKICERKNYWLHFANAQMCGIYLELFLLFLKLGYHLHPFSLSHLIQGGTSNLWKDRKKKLVAEKHSVQWEPSKVVPPFFYSHWPIRSFSQMIYIIWIFKGERVKHSMFLN